MALNLEATIREAGVRIAPEGHHHNRSGWLQFNCPFCSSPDSSKFHMGLNLRFLYVNCWKCGHHALAETLELLLGINRQKSLYLSSGAKKGLIPLPDKENSVERKLELPSRISELLPAHKKYLKSRKFDPLEIFQKWKVQGIGIAPRLEWSLFIPIYFRSKLVSWTTRTLNEDSTKRYHSAAPNEELLPHKTLLYGEDYCRHSVIIHEGPTDVWRTGPGSIATFGVDVTRDQILKLSKYFKRIICFDSSDSAQTRARQLADDLEVFPGETFVIQLDGDDPASSDPKEIKALRKFAFGRHS